MIPTIIPRAGVAEERRTLSHGRPAPLATAVVHAVVELPVARTPDPAEIAAERERDIANAIAAYEGERSEALEREREAARQEGFAAGATEGHDEGRARGLEDGEAIVRERVAKVDAVLASIEATREASLAATEADAIAVGFAAACKLLGASLVTAEGVRAAVQEVLQRIRASERVVVRVSPADLERLETLGAATLIGGRKLELRADAALAHGGCVVETGAGSLEARLELQLEGLKDTLLKAHRGNGEAR